jgi:hypothetical protein
MESGITISGQLGMGSIPKKPVVPNTSEPAPHYTVQEQSVLLPPTGEVISGGVFLIGVLCLILLRLCCASRKSEISFRHR